MKLHRNLKPRKYLWLIAEKLNIFKLRIRLWLFTRKLDIIWYYRNPQYERITLKTSAVNNIIKFKENIILLDMLNKNAKLNKTITYLGLFNLLLIATLLIAKFDADVKIDIFGLSFESVSKYNIFLLLLSSQIYFRETFLGIHNEVIKGALENIVRDKNPRFQEARSIVYLSTFNILSSLFVRAELRHSFLTTTVIISGAIVGLTKVLFEIIAYVVAYIYVLVTIKNTGFISDILFNVIAIYSYFTIIFGFFVYMIFNMVPLGTLKPYLQKKLDLAIESGRLQRDQFFFCLGEKEFRYKMLFMSIAFRRRKLGRYRSYYYRRQLKNRLDG